MTIIHISDELKKEFKVNSDGQSFVSIRGAARLCDIKSQTLDQNLGGGSENTSKLAQILIAHGFEPASMNSTGIPDIALIHILKYYAFKAKRTTEQAERFFDAMSAIGVRTWIQNELGFKEKPQQSNYYKRVMEFIQQNRVPPGYFAVIREALELVGDFEANGYFFKQYDSPDGSIGKCWANYLRKELKVDPESICDYFEYTYPANDLRHPPYPIFAKCYPDTYLAEFRKFMREHYIVKKLPNYLKGKKDDKAIAAFHKMLELPPEFNFDISA